MFDFLKNIKTYLMPEKHYIENVIPANIGRQRFVLSQGEKISTVFTCIKILGETLSKLPLEVYNRDEIKGNLKDKGNYLYDLLHFNPNNYTTSQAFIMAMEVNRNLRGNSFALINRDGNGFVKSLTILDPAAVCNYVVVDGDLYYSLEIGDKTQIVSSYDLLHFRMFTKDGIWGLNPIEALRMNLSTTWKGMHTIDSFYENNATSDKAIKSTVSGANQKIMLEAVEDFRKKYGGATKAGQLIPLPPNTEIQELKLNFDDAKFIDTIKFNAGQIAALFGIPPHMVGNTEASKFNNVEQMNIGFKGDTITPIARMYRQELELKLLTAKQRKDGVSIAFNLNAMVETDYKSRIEGYKTLSQIGVISPNKIASIENLETDINGDVRLVPMNFMTLEKLKQSEKQPNGKQN